MTIDAAICTIVHALSIVHVHYVCTAWHRARLRSLHKCSGNYDNGIWHELFTITLLRGMFYIYIGYYEYRCMITHHYVAALCSPHNAVAAEGDSTFLTFLLFFVCSQMSETRYRRRPSRSGWTSIWKRWDRFSNSRILALVLSSCGVFSFRASLDRYSRHRLN